MWKPALLATGLALAGLTLPASAAPNAQLVNSVQHRLNILGFRHVNASELTSQQIVALHLKLQGPYTSTFRRTRTRQEVKVILGWDGSERKHSLNKTD